MYIAYTPEMLALQKQLREYFAGVLKGSVPSETALRDGSWARGVVLRLGSDGWLGIGWPTEHGGQGRSPLEQFVFFDEARRAGIPIPLLALNTVGPTLMMFGSQEQQGYFLPRILAGELDFAIAYTESEAGTDLASLRTRAVRDGDHYVINGTKMFTTGGGVADYVWLAARTGPATSGHRGLSIFLVPTSAPGFSYTELPVVAHGGTRATTTRPTTMTTYEGVVVPVANRVGDENGGWQIITSQLNHERVALAAGGGWVMELAADVFTWARTTTDPEGELLIDRPPVRRLLAEVDARLEAMKLMNWELVSWSARGDDVTPGAASAANVFGTETIIECCRLLMRAVGPQAYLWAGASGAVVDGRLEQAYRAAVVGTFGGGNNDVQREIIASSALGMPRTRR